MKNLENGARLANAAAYCRDDLRRLLPAIERGIREADTTVLIRCRDLAVQHTNALGHALKHPEYPTGPSRARRSQQPPPEANSDGDAPSA